MDNEARQARAYSVGCGVTTRDPVRPPGQAASRIAPNMATFRGLLLISPGDAEHEFIPADSSAQEP